MYYLSYKGYHYLYSNLFILIQLFHLQMLFLFLCLHSNLFILILRNNSTGVTGISNLHSNLFILIPMNEL